MTDGLPTHKKIPQRLERQGISHFSKASDIDHVPTGELVCDTKALSIPLGFNIFSLLNILQNILCSDYQYTFKYT